MTYITLSSDSNKNETKKMNQCRLITIGCAFFDMIDYPDTRVLNKQNENALVLSNGITRFVGLRVTARNRS